MSLKPWSFAALAGLVFSVSLPLAALESAEAAITPPVAIPRLPTGAQFARFRWELGSIDPSLEGAVFEIEAQEASAPTGGRPGTYRFRMPRLAGARAPLRVREIKVLVNDRWDPAGTAFLAVDRVIAPGALPEDPAALLPFPVLSSKAIVVAQAAGEGDQIRIEFDEIGPAADFPACNALELYRANVEPILRAKNCASCHSSDTDAGMGNARVRFPMTGDEAALCSRMLQRADTARPEDSAIIDYPLRRANGHTRVITSNGDVIPAWTSWIEAERRERRRGSLVPTRAFRKTPTGGSP